MRTVISPWAVTSHLAGTGWNTAGLCHADFGVRFAWWRKTKTNKHLRLIQPPFCTRPGIWLDALISVDCPVLGVHILDTLCCILRWGGGVRLREVRCLARLLWQWEEGWQWDPGLYDPRLLPCLLTSFLVTFSLLLLPVPHSPHLLFLGKDGFLHSSEDTLKKWSKLLIKL